MKKQELRDLLKLGQPGVQAKIAELQSMILDFKLKLSRGEEKNLRVRKNLRRDLARLLTHSASLKEVK